MCVSNYYLKFSVNYFKEIALNAIYPNFKCFTCELILTNKIYDN